MPLRSYDAELTRTLPVPPALAWAILVDTNRWDRVIGYRPSQFTYELLDPADPQSRTRVGRSRMMGMDIGWVDLGSAIEGRSLNATRKFLNGPVAEGGYRFTVEPDGAASRVRITVGFLAADMLPAEMAESMRARTQGILERYFDALVPLLASWGEAARPSAHEPALALARRLMLRSRPDAMLAGKPTPLDEAAFAFHKQRFDQAPLDPEVSGRLCAMLRERPDDDLRQMRPFEVAGAWGLDRREVVRAFLYAARAGLLDLRWQLDCPVCRVGAGVATTLENVQRDAHCPDCDIAFDLDFAFNVEAVFTVNAAIRPIREEVYCASSPWDRPHIFGAFRVPPRETQSAAMVLPSALGIRGPQKRALLLVDQPPPACVTVRVAPGELAIETSAALSTTAETELRCINDTDTLAFVQLERADWQPDLVTGATILSFPEFLDLFGTEAPALGMDLTVSSATVLFSDLTGTTALYRQLGDSRAYAIVQEHFFAMTRVISQHEGAVIKTMGDAVMATFSSPARALAAGVEMVRQVMAAARDRGLGELAIKIGLNQGPCLAVRANNRLDLFGTTVNVAARLQGKAHPNQVVLLDQLSTHRDVQRLLESGGVVAERYQAQLKGFAEPYQLLAVKPT